MRFQLFANQQDFLAFGGGGWPFSWSMSMEPYLAWAGNEIGLSDSSIDWAPVRTRPHQTSQRGKEHDLFWFGDQPPLGEFSLCINFEKVRILDLHTLFWVS